ncbi:MAG: TolC family protein [Chlamydiae bacterium]|nr:TolC family protein [Chlamydiota bacterium]
MRAANTAVVALTFLSAAGIPCRAAESTLPASLSLSLRETIERAHLNNKELQMQAKEIRAARADRLGAVTPFLPRLDIDGGYTRNSATLFENGDASFAADSDKDIGVFTGYKNTLRAGGTVAQSIYRGGGDYAALKKADLEIRVREETLRALKLDVEFEAKRLYHGLLLAHENVCIAENLLAQAQAHYAVVARKFEQGTSSRFDLLQSKVHVSLLLPQVVTARNSVDLTDADLKKLLSLRMGDRVVLTGRLEHASIAIDEERFLARALARRPEMVLKALGVDMEAWAIRQARATRLPRVDAVLDTFFQSDKAGDLFNSQHNLWNAGVTVGVPIFDGFYTKSRVDAAWARYARAGLSRENTEEETAVAVRRACLDLRQASAIIESQRDNVDEAREALRISEVAYDNGVGTNLDVLDSLVSLSQAQQYYASGIYEYLMARAALDRAMGESAAGP